MIEARHYWPVLNISKNIPLGGTTSTFKSNYCNVFHKVEYSIFTAKTSKMNLLFLPFILSASRCFSSFLSHHFKYNAISKNFHIKPVSGAFYDKMIHVTLM